MAAHTTILDRFALSRDRVVSSRSSKLRRLSGSSSYECLNSFTEEKATRFVKKTILAKQAQLRTYGTDKVTFVESDICEGKYCVYEDEHEKVFMIKKKRPRRPGYELNKKKVMDKCHALFETDAAQKFLAFYSISFKAGTTEDQAYQVFNSWLTNCRKRYNLRTYLWVAEYQGNGTIHFHLLTVNFMEIRKVNEAMRKALVNAGLLDDSVKYNGVDVERVEGDKRKLSAYLTKYVAKQADNVYPRQPWRCSRDVSAMFTKITLRCQDAKILEQDIIDKDCPFSYFQNDYCAIVHFNKKLADGSYYHAPESLYKEMRRVNNEILDRYAKFRKCFDDDGYLYAPLKDINEWDCPPDNEQLSLFEQEQLMKILIPVMYEH